MKVKDLLCWIESPVYFDLSNGNYINTQDIFKFAEYYVIQISADVNYAGDQYVLIDISPTESAQDEKNGNE